MSLRHLVRWWLAGSPATALPDPERAAAENSRPLSTTTIIREGRGDRARHH